MARTAEQWQALFQQLEQKVSNIESQNLSTYVKNLDSRMTTMEVAVANIGTSRSEKIEEKNKFWKEVLESKAIANISKLSSPGEYRMWSKKFKNAYEQVRLYARKTLHWLDTVKEKDILGEMELGHVNMTAMEAVMEHLSMERANDMKGGGIKYDGMEDT